MGVEDVLLVCIYRFFYYKDWLIFKLLFSLINRLKCFFLGFLVIKNVMGYKRCVNLL